MADGEDTWASYHSVVAGVRIIQQLGGPERLKVFLINDLNGREDLVYDSEMHPGTCLHHLRMVAHEFGSHFNQQRKTLKLFVATSYIALAGLILTKPCTMKTCMPCMRMAHE